MVQIGHSVSTTTDSNPFSRRVVGFAMKVCPLKYGVRLNDIFRMEQGINGDELWPLL